jgi:two-component system KDP operon response regulator KdpE
MTEPTATILVVEDERPIRRFIRPALEGEGFRVLEAATQREALAMASMHVPELMVLDLGLPDGDGCDVVTSIREWSSMPIIVVSARGREEDKVKALDVGADDYLTKPFSVPELLARIRVALRHAARIRADSPAATTFTVGDLSVDLLKRRVRLAGTDLQLTPIEFTLLAQLARHPGRVFTHKALLEAVWGPSRLSEPHLVRVHLANLRRKVEKDTARPRYLLTEPGVGYRLADE